MVMEWEEPVFRCDDCPHFSRCLRNLDGSRCTSGDGICREMGDWRNAAEPACDIWSYGEWWTCGDCAEGYECPCGCGRVFCCEKGGWTMDTDTRCRWFGIRRENNG